MKFYGGVFIILAVLILAINALPNYQEKLMEDKVDIQDEELGLNDDPMDDAKDQKTAFNNNPIDSEVVHLTRQKRQITCTFFGNGLCNARCRAMGRRGGSCNGRRICVCH